MQENKMALTENVKKSIKMIRYLLNRPKMEMVGLGLLYGAPGLGKSRFAKRFAIQNNFMYIRLESTTTAKSFADDLYELLCRKYNFSPLKIGSKSSNYVFNLCKEILNDAQDPVIFVDEIDYAFTYAGKQLLGSIRDLVDETLAVILLVGMQDAKKQLLRANAHYFDRCNYFVQYKKLNLKDVQTVVDEIAEIELDKATVKQIYTTTQGTLRKVIKLLHAIEQIARSRGKKQIEYKDIKGIL